MFVRLPMMSVMVDPPEWAGAFGKVWAWKRVVRALSRRGRRWDYRGTWFSFGCVHVCLFDRDATLVRYPWLVGLLLG